MSEPLNIVVLGSTGSIGTQTLDVVRRNSHLIKVVGLVAQKNVSLLIEQAREFTPRLVALYDAEASAHVKAEMDPKITVFSGSAGISSLIEQSGADAVVAAIVGFAGLQPVLDAIKARIPVAIANKESLVAAGDIVVRRAREKAVPLIPIDSEHSAIYQCLEGRSNPKEIKEITLTASGGPFFGWSREKLSSVTPQQAVSHPKWNMGAKNSLDSATLMNKGLEVIEASKLFDFSPSEIKVVIHPQAIVHGMVQYRDGNMRALLFEPDMRIPISYALECIAKSVKKSFFNDATYSNGSSLINLASIEQLSFYPPDNDAFPCLDLAYEALREGGTMTTVLNASNEIAVECFLSGGISFLQIPEVVKETLGKHKKRQLTSLEDVYDADTWARGHASKLCSG